MNASLIRMLLAGAVSVLGASAQAGGGIDASRLAPVRGEPKPVQRAAPEPPVRAYAIDGASFYYGGRHFVIDGMAPPRAGDELAVTIGEGRVDPVPELAVVADLLGHDRIVADPALSRRPAAGNDAR